MATIDLGKIKQVFRGTYNNATAYTVDDLVSFTDTVGGLQNTSTYIAVANTTGNAPASGGTIHASWNLVAQGVPDRLPSQSGNANKFLKTDGSALSFDTACGMVKLASASLTGQTLSNISIDYFSTTYKAYYFVFSNLRFSAGAYIRMRLKKNADNAVQTGDKYEWHANHPYNQSSGSGDNNHGSWTNSKWDIGSSNAVHANWSLSGNVTFYDPMSTTRKTSATWTCHGYEGDRTQHNGWTGFGSYLQQEQIKGIYLYPNTGTISEIQYSLFGIIN